MLRYIAANVKIHRVDRHLTQEGLAEIAGIDPTSMQRVETAKVNLTVDVLVRIADALTVEPSELLRPARFRLPRRGRPRTK